MATSSTQIEALKLALPHVERAAAAQPTTLSRHQRQQEAAKAVVAIKAALAQAEAA